jgi:hypothetical protein
MQPAAATAHGLAGVRIRPTGGAMPAAKRQRTASLPGPAEAAAPAAGLSDAEDGEAAAAGGTADDDTDGQWPAGSGCDAARASQ